MAHGLFLKDFTHLKLVKKKRKSKKMAQRSYGLQSLKYSPPGPVQRKFPESRLDAQGLVWVGAKDLLSKREALILGFELGAARRRCTLS